MLRGVLFSMAMTLLVAHSANAQVSYGGVGASGIGAGAAAAVGADALTTMPHGLRNDDYLRAVPSISVAPSPPPPEAQHLHVPHAHAHYCHWVRPCEGCGRICVDD
jgi:hypothetical protein